MPIIRWGHETEITNVEWLWKPLIPYGKVTIIEGDGGDGKTTMILTVAAMLSQGIQPPTLERGHLLSTQKVDPVTTFYLTNEDEVSDSSLKRFIRAGGITNRFAYSGELQHHMTLVEDELLEAINNTNARLLIIDPFQAFLPEGTNMGSITKMRSIFTTLSNVAKQTGTAIVLVGHLNKNEGRKDIHRGFGSADIAASVRSILMVEMDKKNRDNRWVRTIKSNFDESDYTPIGLVFDDERRLSFEEMRFPKETTKDGNAAEYQTDYYTEENITPPTKLEKAIQLLEVLLEDEALPKDDILGVLNNYGISDRTVRRTARELGIISQTKSGVTTWRLKDTY